MGTGTTEVMLEDIEIPDQEFCVAPQYRRAMGIAAWGMTACSWLVHILAMMFDNVPFLSTGILIPLLITLAAYFALWWVRHWRIRIDGTGIHKRVFIRWRTWPWAAFARGTVVAGNARGSFVFRDLPWYLRRLSFEGLDSTDRDRLLEICIRDWVVPAPPQPPDELYLRLGATAPRYFRRGSLRANRYGLELDRGGRTKAYNWSDVQKLIVFRTSHEHFGFKEVHIHLPDTVEKIVYDSKHGAKMWAGPEPEILSAFFLQHVASDKVVNCATSGPARSLMEADIRIARMNESLKKHRRLVRVVQYSALLALVAYVVYHRPHRLSDALAWMGALLLASIGIGLYIVAVPAVVTQMFRENLAELEREREEFTLNGKSNVSGGATK